MEAVKLARPDVLVVSVLAGEFKMSSGSRYRPVRTRGYDIAASLRFSAADKAERDEACAPQPAATPP
jgi:hypothetical protein